MTAPPSVTVGDLEFAFYKAAVPASDNNLAVTMGQGVVINSAQTAGKYSSVSATGNATTPPANTSICAVTPAVAGYYRIDCIVGFDGTAEATTANNFVIHIGGGIPAGVGNMICVNATNTLSPVQTYYATLNGAQTVSIDNPIVGSAGSVYKASVTCTRLA